MTFVFWVIKCSIVWLLMHLVEGSISAQTSFAPVRANGMALAAKVCAGKITSSSGPKSQHNAANSKAAVQLETAKEWVTPQNSEKELSKSAWYFP